MTELARMRSTLSAASRRKLLRRRCEKMRYSVNTSSVVTMREVARSDVRQSLPVGAIGRIRESNPIERVGKNSVHTWRLGQP